jgi:hypothetical protein
LGRRLLVIACLLSHSDSGLNEVVQLPVMKLSKLDRVKAVAVSVLQ